MVGCRYTVFTLLGPNETQYGVCKLKYKQSILCLTCYNILISLGPIEGSARNTGSVIPVSKNGNLDSAAPSKSERLNSPNTSSWAPDVRMLLSTAQWLKVHVQNYRSADFLVKINNFLDLTIYSTDEQALGQRVQVLQTLPPHVYGKNIFLACFKMISVILETC